MDVTDETPERWWVKDAERHLPPVSRRCLRCNAQSIDFSQAVPMAEEIALCQNCATDAVKDHPMTATYVQWMSTGDLRWWSPWVCQCEGCGADV